jgi:hypothetical protein
VIDFNFDERAVDQIAKDAVQAEAKEIQKMLDRLLRQYTGSPVPEVKAALVREWRKGGGNISDPELSDWATLISNGTRIHVQT